MTNLRSLCFSVDRMVFLSISFCFFSFNVEVNRAAQGNMFFQQRVQHKRKSETYITSDKISNLLLPMVFLQISAALSCPPTCRTLSHTLYSPISEPRVRPWDPVHTPNGNTRLVGSRYACLICRRKPFSSQFIKCHRTKRSAFASRCAQDEAHRLPLFPVSPVIFLSLCLLMADLDSPPHVRFKVYLTPHTSASFSWSLLDCLKKQCACDGTVCEQ